MSIEKRIIKTAKKVKLYRALQIAVRDMKQASDTFSRDYFAATADELNEKIFDMNTVDSGIQIN